MIKSLEAWSLQVCAIALAAAIWSMLFPNLKKYGVFSVMRLTMVLCAVRLLLPILYDVADPYAFDRTDFSTEDAENAYALEFSEVLSDELYENLLGRGIKVRDVRIEISVTQEGLSVDRAVLVPQEGADLTAEAGELALQWGIPVGILKIGGDT